MHDVIIVGGGVAGLTAAVWLGRYRRSTLVISSGPSRNASAKAIHGFPGSEGGDPRELLDRLCREALGYGTDMVSGWAERVEKTDEGFAVLCGGRRYEGRRILLATGTVDEKPDIPGFDEYEGVSAWHCPACDGYEYTGKRVAVVSWGEQMAGYALHFLPYTDSITVLTHGNEPGVPREHMAKLEQNNIEVRTERIEGIEGEDGQVERLLLEGGETLECDGIFYSVGCRARLELLEQLECEITEDCSIAITHKQETDIPGVYAAGDIAPMEELVVVAAGMGAVAASNIHDSLVPESQKVE